MSTYTTEAICLRTIDFGEKDKILHLYSPELGRISAIAKGVKGPKSKLAGACNLLHISQVQLSRGRTLDVLCQYESIEPFQNLHHDILKLAYATLFAEEINFLSMEHDEDSQALFQMLKETLKQMEYAAEEAVVPLATAFQMNLLGMAGYEPLLNLCMICDSEISTEALYYGFSAELGGILCSHCEHDSHIPTTIVNVTTSTLQVLHAPLEADWTGVNKLKVQKFLKYYFAHKLEKQLRSFDFVLSLLEADEISSKA